MASWVAITIAAAFLQNARSAMQKQLKGRLGGAGATFVRFGYGLPFAALFFVGAAAVEGAAIPPNARFAAFVLVAAMAQILATAALLKSFDYANFAVGTAFSKTEPLLAAAAGAILLREVPAPLAWGAMALGAFGVWLATLRAGADGARRINWAAAGYGVAAAALFGLSAVGYRGASLALPFGSAALRASETLLAATLLQTLAMAAWMARYAPDDLRAAGRAWRPGLLVGFFGAAASAGWFTAMTLEPAAHVRALAQVELVFTLMASVLWFRERPGLREVIGVACVAAGVALLLFSVSSS